MDCNDLRKQVWAILPKMTKALTNVLSIAPTYNANLSKLMGIRPYPKNRGNGNFLVWTLLRDERTAKDSLSCGALDENVTESSTKYSNKNIVVSEDSHNDAVVNYETEIIKNSYLCIQESVKQLCDILKIYITNFPDKAYGGAFIRDMDVNLCEVSASGEFVDYLIKALLHQKVIDYTGEIGPRGSHLLKVVSDASYTIQPQIDLSKFRNGMSKGEALAALTFSDILMNDDVIHQKKWKDCRDKKELPFDFWDHTNDVVIEIDGAQHFRPVSIFGGYESFDKVVSHDTIKNNYVADNGMRMLRIDSSTRDVRECMQDYYSKLDGNTPIVTLYGDNYTHSYISRIDDSYTVLFDNWNVIKK